MYGRTQVGSFFSLAPSPPKTIPLVARSPSKGPRHQGFLF